MPPHIPSLRRALLLPSTLLAALSASTTRAAVPPKPGMRIAGPMHLSRGEYHLADAESGRLQVSGSGYTLDLKDVRLIGDGKGVGIQVTNARNVTLRNADVSGCRWGIVLEHCTNVRLENCTASRNGDLPPGTVIDESGREAQDQHGGGILLRDSTGCRVHRCTAQYEWDGIDVVRSDGNTIDEGDYSFDGNWGLHLWQSSRNVFRGNRAIWCTTGSGTLFQALTGWQTYDAQAVAIEHSSNDNVIEENDLRFGGDGVFIRANEGGEEPGKAVPPKNSSDRNILRNNDCSYSPNNAIEVDFVAGTVIEGNNCSYSNYGMWLGYSRGTRVRNNTCIDDSTRAIEIENGQNGTIIGNVLGWEHRRPDADLVFLRQNGRDATPSGPYNVVGNLFYGAGSALRLLKTREVRFVRNRVADAGGAARAVVADAESVVAENSEESTAAPAPVLEGGVTLRPGSLVKLRGRHLSPGTSLPAVLVNGIPAWVRQATEREIRFWMPNDFWDRPAPDRVELRVVTRAGRSAAVAAVLDWPQSLPRVAGINPNPANPGEIVTITGSNLTGTGSVRVLLNKRPADLVSASAERVVFRAPVGMVIPTRYNLLLERRGAGASDRTWPIPFSVHLQAAQLPHLTTASFSPTTLRVGEVLHVSFTVKNNLPYAAPLQQKPTSGFRYDEKQAWSEIGLEEQVGELHLRVTSDHPGAHHPGSWPWMFGFGKPFLAPGETLTITGEIRVETPGEHVFKAGLVAGGSRFIDDNAFPTRITVLPR